jgi:hypothetical protein
MYGRDVWRRWAQFSLCSTLAAGACSSKPEVGPAPTPTPGPVSVVGVLRDGYTGHPITSGEVVLEDRMRPPYDIVQRARPDAEGRFKFAKVDTAERLSVGWKADEAAKKLLLTADELQPDAVQSALDAPSGNRVELRTAGKPVDLGAVDIWLEAPARMAFAQACQTGRPVGTVPAGSGLVVFVSFPGQKSRHTYSTASYLQHDIAPVWPSGWKGVTCIDQTKAKVGSYSGAVFGDAFRVTWRVRAVRLPDGRTFTTTLVADPPEKITERDASAHAGGIEGNPMPKLQQWIRGLTANAP